MLGGGPPPSRARWFSVVLTRANAPWAFEKGEPFRTVAALELFGTLLSLVAFSPQWPLDLAGYISIQGTTDNAGNSCVVTKLMTSKYPMVVILAEVAAQARRRRISLGLNWVPRDQNEAADALTNSDFSEFDMARRIELEVESIDWIVLTEYMRAAKELYAATKQLRENPGGSGGGKAGKTKPLREQDPWL